MVEEIKETKETKEEAKVVLAQTPTEFGLVFKTPDGTFDTNEYLAWLGNMLVDIKQSLVG